MSSSISPLTTIHSSDAPAAIGPYSQAIAANGMVFCSGQIPLDPVTMKMVGEGDVQAQTKQVLTNLTTVLKAAGSDLDLVVKTLVFLKDMNDFKAMNEIYAQFFTHHKPARAAVQVARLPQDCLVEIECIAMKRQAS